MHFKHLTLITRDIEKSIAFYQTMAELTVARRYHEGEAQLAFLTDGRDGTEIELVQMAQMQPFEGKGMFLCFETNKLDAMHALAAENNLNPSPIRIPDEKSRYFYVYDPNGVSVQLREYA